MRLLKAFRSNWQLFIDTFIATARGDDTGDTARALDELGKQAKIAAHWMTQYLLAHFIGRSLKEKIVVDDCPSRLATL